MISEENKLKVIEYLKLSRKSFNQIWHTLAPNEEFSYEEMLDFYGKYVEEHGEIARPTKKKKKLDEEAYDETIMNAVNDGRSVKDILFELKKQDKRINEDFIDKRCKSLGIIEQLYVQQTDDRYDDYIIELVARGYTQYMQICTLIRNIVNEPVNQKKLRYRVDYVLRNNDYKEHPAYKDLLEIIKELMMKGTNASQISIEIGKYGYHYNINKVKSIMEDLCKENDELRRALVVNSDELVTIEQLYKWNVYENYTPEEIAMMLNKKYGSNIKANHIERKISKFKREKMCTINRRKTLEKIEQEEQNKTEEEKQERLNKQAEIEAEKDEENKKRAKTYRDFSNEIIALKVQGMTSKDIATKIRDLFGIEITERNVRYLWEKYKANSEIINHPVYKEIKKVIYSMVMQGCSVEDIRLKLREENVRVSKRKLKELAKKIKITDTYKHEFCKDKSKIPTLKELDMDAVIRLFMAIKQTKNASVDQIIKFASEEYGVELKPEYFSDDRKKSTDQNKKLTKTDQNERVHDEDGER